MIQAIGVDSVDISRFSGWHKRAPRQLGRLFSDTEIAYSMSVPSLSAQRFAVRFAAKEAFAKAFYTLFAPHMIPLLALCKIVSVEKQYGAPCIAIDYSLLPPFYHALQDMRIHLSLTHSQHTASAFLIIEK